MHYDPYPFGPVAIIPASAMRDNRDFLRPHRDQNIPINAAYYLTPQRPAPPPPSVYPTHIPRVTPPYYPREPSVIMVPGTPSTYRRSMSAPAPPNRTRSRAYRRSYTADIFAEPPPPARDPRATPLPVRSFSGPVKYPEPMYRKRQFYKKTRGGNFVPAESYEMRSPWTFAQTSSRRSFVAPGLRRTYAPTYTTYPPSSVYRQRRRGYSDGFNYSSLWRIALKVAQLV